MIRWLVGSSLKLRRVVVAVAVGLVVVGIFQVRELDFDALPEFSPTVVEVQTEALGLSAPEVEQLITVPLEQDLLNGVAFLDSIESISMPGLSSIVLTFEPGTPLLDARQVVGERLTQAHALPQVSKPPQMLQPLSSTSRAQIVRLSSQRLTPIETSVLARWVIVPRLLGVDGVANVAIWGQRDRQLQVQVDPARLAANGTNLSQVIHTAGNALEFSPLSFLEASKPGTGGFIDTLNQRFQIFHEQAINTPEELAGVPIQDSDGRPVLGPDGLPLALGSVTTVVEDHQPLIGDAICRQGPCVLLVVEKFPGANTADVTEGVEAALDVLRPGLGDMVIDTSVYRPATAVGSAFGNVGWRLLIGLGLLLLVLAVFFRDWRTGVVSVAAVATSLAVAVLVLRVTGATVNLIVLLGLIAAVTAVVDDAVGDTHNLARRIRSLRADQPDAPLWRVAVEASGEMRKAAFCALLVLAAAALPVFSMGAEAGVLLPEVVRSYLLAAGLSMLVAFTLTPALATVLFSSTSPAAVERPAAGWTGRRYEALARRTVPLGRAALLAVIALLAVGTAAVAVLDARMRPALERDLLVDVAAEPGTSLPRMREIVGRAVNEVGAVPGVANVGAHVGRAVLSDERANVNSAQMWVSLDDGAGRPTVERIRAVLSRLQGVDAAVRTYWDKRLADVVRPPSDDLVVRVYGENAQIRRDKAEEIRQRVSAVKGISAARVEYPREEPTVQVEVDLARARAAGLKPGDVRREVSTLVSGITVGNLYEQQKVFDVVVWGTPELRRSADDLANLRIEAPNGRSVRLGEVAQVRQILAPAVIRHESVFTYLDVSASVKGRALRDAAGEVDRVVGSVPFPLEHHAELLDRHDDGLAARQKFLVLTAIGAVGVLLLLQAATASWRLAVLAFVTIPVSVVGGLGALWATGIGLTPGSVAGLLAVLGLGTRHALVLLRRAQAEIRTGAAELGDDLVVRCAVDRLVPVLGVAAGTAVIQIPFLFGAGAIGIGLIRPMAVTVLGGLVTTLVLTLVLLPALVRRYGRVEAPDFLDEELFAPLPDEPVLSGPGR